MSQAFSMRFITIVAALVFFTSPSLVAADPCTVCADGSSSSVVSATCSNLAETANALQAGTNNCKEVQSNGFLFCGCPSLPTPPESPTCHLCPDGDTPAFADKIVSGTNMNCGDFAEYVQFIQNEGSCGQYQRATALHCGCQPKSTCTSVCPTGSAPSLQNSLGTTDSDETCGDVEAHLAKNAVQSDTCSQYEYLGVKSCGCSVPTTPTPSTCDLCQDGSIPPNWNLDVAIRKNCLQIAGEALFEAAPEQCSAYQASFGPYCGCNNDNEADACRICGADNFLPDPNRLATSDGTLSCAQAEFEATQNPNTCASTQSTYQSACCAETAAYDAPKKDCRICQDGSYPANGDQAVNLPFGDFTCGFLAHFPSVIPDSFCESISNILDSHCGCGTKWITLVAPDQEETPESNGAQGEEDCTPRKRCSGDSDCCLDQTCNTGKCFAKQSVGGPDTKKKKRISADKMPWDNRKHKMLRA